MKSLPSGLMKAAVHCLMAGFFALVITGMAFAQSPAQDMLKGAAKEVLGINQPVQGQTEMMDGAKMMMQGRHALREDLIRSGKLKKEEGLSGGKLMNDGNDAVVEGDRLIRSERSADGKKKMLDGTRMMADARKTMMDDLARRGMINKAAPLQGETMMSDGEKLMKKGEMMMLK